MLIGALRNESVQYMMYKAYSLIQAIILPSKNKYLKSSHVYKV